MTHTRPLKTLLTASVISLVAASYSSALANAGPKAASTDCCDALGARVSKLEGRAVQSTGSTMKVDGYVNRAIMSMSDGFRSTVANVSNHNMLSNIQFTGKSAFSPDLSFGTVVRIDVGTNSPLQGTGSGFFDVGRSQSNAESEASIRVRFADLNIDSASMGKLSLGRGPYASSGVIYATDLSGTSVFLHPFTTIGGISFKNAATGRPLSPSGLTGRSSKVGFNIFEAGDGACLSGRGDRVRYDTPAITDANSPLQGFSASTSHGSVRFGNIYDVALKYMNMLSIPYSSSKTVVAAQASWSFNTAQDTANGLAIVNNLTQIAATPNDPTRPNDNNVLIRNNADLLKGAKFSTINGAIGILFPFSMSGKEGTGINTHFSAVHRKWKMDNQKNGRVLHGKLGYTDAFFGIGKTRLITNYGKWTAMDLDFNTNVPAALGGTGGPITLVGTNVGVGVVQDIDVASSQVYLRYDNMKLDRQGTTNSFKDINIVYAGALVKL